MASICFGLNELTVIVRKHDMKCDVYPHYLVKAKQLQLGVIVD